MSLVLTSIMGQLGLRAETVEKEVVIFGGTPGGIAAAIAAKREGASVVLLEQTRHVGGVSTSGLNRDEGGHMERLETFGGLADRFVQIASLRSDDDWHENRRGFARWHSNKAEDVFLEMLEAADVEVRYGQLLDTVEVEDHTITTLRTRDGTGYNAKVYVDATYEGDLMAAAGVDYVTGRESREEFDESEAGVRLGKVVQVNPYDEEGNLLFGVMPGEVPEEGSASPHPMAYNIRLNITKGEDRVPFTKPDDYDPAMYELLGRAIEAGALRNRLLRDVIAFMGLPGDKRELNNQTFGGAVSMSIPGAQTPWGEATYEEREEIHELYRRYTHGLLWFLQIDPRVPAESRAGIAEYGFCGDQWVDNNHWPWYLYIREGRRMRGAYIMTQSDVTSDRAKADTIALGSHSRDAHAGTRYATSDGKGYINEGRLWTGGASRAFDIPYRTLTPKAEQIRNLLVPVCLSTTHVAFCPIRLEPTWMQLGEAAGIAAAQAADKDLPVQKVDVESVQQALRNYGLPLEISPHLIVQHTANNLHLTVPNGDLVPAADDGTHFGKEVGTEREFIIHNTSGKPLTITDVTLENNEQRTFEVITEPVSALEKDGKTCLTIRFEPPNGGDFSANVNITSQPGDGEPHVYTWQIRGGTVAKSSAGTTILN